jgi:hypothetical protein
MHGYTDIIYYTMYNSEQIRTGMRQVGNQNDMV